ncbi:hypothetical protein [Limosilactobacillus coleohominis]|uniref:hypothetical protein n=1 Tax=Limosilactobacillus coleohominis TaxID=181675 RepID=UPI00195BD565|nr:hypothetical protein [Limosilactobacillus coleohominis]MBM6955113.1 hypothetical protein [Limosilactobacillus coleohominis]
MKYFTRQEIVNQIRASMNDYDESNNIGNLFDDLFNSDYYIIDSYKAAKALDSDWQDDWSGLLNQYSVDLPGVFGALQLVRHYDEATIGIEDINVDEFLDPERIANKVEYILAAYQMDQILISNNLDYESCLTNHVKTLLVQ